MTQADFKIAIDRVSWYATKAQLVMQLLTLMIVASIQLWWLIPITLAAPVVSWAIWKYDRKHILGKELGKLTEVNTEWVVLKNDLEKIKAKLGIED